MTYRVRHLTRLTYASPVVRARFNLRLAPWPWPGQSLEQFNLTCGPEPAEQVDRSGPYCVTTTTIGFADPLDRLEVRSEFTMRVDPPAFAGPGPTQEQVSAEALGVRDLSATAPAPYLFESRIAGTDGPIAAWATGLLDRSAAIMDGAAVLMRAINQQFAYQPGTTTSATAPEEAFANRTGVCQDFAHVMIVALRSQGIPAAYASGYLRTRPPPGKPRLVGADAMHAWVMVWCGQALGWIGFDPTNDCLALGDHLLIAMGRDYADVSPIDGIFVGSPLQSVSSSVDVEWLG